jgi:hypothetical protein
VPGNGFRAGRKATWLVSATMIALVLPPAALAQVGSNVAGPGVSRPVVQPLPPVGVADLNAALGRLARNSQDVDALVDAGNASLKLGDIDAAIGFFSRADVLAPGNARSKAGLAAAYVRSENPFDALLMFDEAEKAGAVGAELAGDRGLAHDLVGDSLRAQELYRQKLLGGPDDEVSRRLALSLAISGDRIGAEAALRPLLDRRDLSAYRTRAFALAILGDIKGAMAIVDVRLTPDMASRLAPYLRYMPRLTPAQQAAAANFGHFPQAADVGRDDPRIAARPGSRPRSRTADAGLIPSGEPLGAAMTASAPKETRKERRQREEREALLARQEAEARVKAQASAERARAEASERARTEALARAAEAERARTTALARAEAEARARSAEAARVAMAERAQPAPGPAEAAPVAPPVPAPSLSIAMGPPAPVTSPSQRAPAVVPAAAPVVAAPAVPVSTPPVEVAPVVSAPAVVPTPPARQLSVAEAFSDLSLPPPPARPAAGAVDLSKIKPKRDPLPEPKVAAPPPKPVTPSRIWVQVGTGRNRDALAFDWRRYTREEAELFKGRKPHVAKWGQTNRLLAGPFASDKEAQAFLKKVKAAKIDSFAFTSDEGEAVDPLPSAR